MMNEYKEYLESLRQKLKDQNLSLLVGAGFSKNVNNELFPSWWQLLEEMVMKMNINLYAHLFKQNTGKNPESSKEEYSNFCKEQINLYIEDTGYLNVVSNYIKRMGFRETVDVYIEENTPLAVNIDGKPFLRIKDGKQIKNVPIVKDNLKLHAKLIKLPWNNIYTTNYDNLLEFCIDYETMIGLESLSKKIEEEIQQLRDDIPGLKLELHKATEDAGQNPSLDDNGFAIFDDRRKAVFSLESTLRSKELRLKNLNEKIATIEEALNECYNIVKHSSELAIKRNRNIIKLHGSLPDQTEDLFAFDNEFDKRYIISREDYEQYPVRHEAFTQLMRISLLQGHFCLIGFSGDDPNFLAWVSWIRSVVMQNGGSNSDIKIYLIDVRAEAPSDSHKEQFYKNHRIVHIPLCHTDCISFLENASGIVINKADVKEVLTNLIDYLGDIPAIDIPQISYERLARERYNTYMDLLENPKKHYPTIDDVKTLCRHYTDLISLKKFNRIPSFSELNNESKMSMILEAKTYYQQIAIQEPSIMEHFIGIVSLILEDLFLPFSCVMPDENFQELKNAAKGFSKKLYYEFLKHELKNAIWQCDTDATKKLHQMCRKVDLNAYKEDCSILLAMEAAVSLKFGDLKKAVEKTPAGNKNCIAIAGYWGIFNPEKARKYLMSEEIFLAQENVYALEIMNILNDFSDDKRNKQQNERKQRLKQHGLRTIQDNQDFVLSKFKKYNNKVEPLESDDFISGEIFGSKSDREAICLQMLGMMLESGLPFARNGFYLQHKDSVYPILNRVFKRYPMPVLYFVLQYGDDKFTKRIGQDYAFTNKLETEPQIIFECVSNCYLDLQTPSSYKEKLLVFLAEFIISLEPATWQKFFLLVWEEKKNNKTLFSKDKIDDYSFFESALHFISDARILKKVVADCLEHSTGPSSLERCIHYLFLLNNNPAFQDGKLQGLLNKKITSNINHLIELINKDTECLFILGNLYSYLLPEQIKLIKERLKKSSFGIIRSSNLWSVIIHFCDSSRSIKRKVVSEIIASELLWKNGIFVTEQGKNGIRYGVDFIKLRNLRKMKDGKKWLTFEPKEVLEIYNKLKVSLAQISGLNRSNEHNFNPILREMRWFLDAESTILEKESDYSQTRDTVEYCSSRKHTTQNLIVELSSDSMQKINNAFSDVSRELYDNKEFEKHHGFVSLVVNKILLKHSPGLILSLEYLTKWCEDFTNENSFQKLKLDLLDVLTIYHDDYPQQLAVPKLEELLIRLAFILHAWGVEHQIISYYLGLIDNSRFNNIKYTLKSELDNRTKKALSNENISS
jgi:hypothetical protein